GLDYPGHWAGPLVISPQRDGATRTRPARGRGRRESGHATMLALTTTLPADEASAMRAFAVDDFGSKGSVHEVPVPEPGPGEVLVRVHAASVHVMAPLYTAGWINDDMEHRF